MADGRFEETYWTEHSQYRKFDGYEAGLTSTEQWYRGFFRLIQRHLPDPCTAIDVGCGHGAIPHMLHRRGFAATGLDTSQWMVDHATAHGGPRFLVGDALELPNEPYGLITCLEVLEHLPDPVAALAGFHDRLTSEGRLIATTPNLSPRIPWWDPVKADPTHINVHAPEWWTAALHKAGFDQVHVSTFLTVPVLWKVGLGWWVRMGAHAGPGVLLVATRR